MNDKIIVSLTTVPERLSLDREDGLKDVIFHLCAQDDSNYEVHFNIPFFSKITGQEYVIPDWLKEFENIYSHLRIFRTDDLGPSTKFIPTLLRDDVDPESVIIVVDDDLVYHKELVSEHRKYQNLLINSVIGYDGRGVDLPIHHDIRDSWVICVTQITKTHFLQHYKSVSYKKKLFENDFFDFYVGKTLSDDVLISTYFRHKQIPLYSVPYEKEIHLFNTRELWDENQGVTTFPILRRAASVEDTGCNHPEILKLQPKFFEPEDFKNVQIKNDEFLFKQFNTDKKNHGYMSLYHPLFLKLKNIKKVLEIGIYQGESLKMLSAYFKDALICGMDINDCSCFDSEKIKTFICNQENKNDLEKFIQESGSEFDLIIDDGGHTMKQQQTSFGVLFKFLKPGGTYILEDLHTSKLEGWFTSDDEIKTLDMLEKLKNENILISNHISCNEKEYILNNVESVNIWTRTPCYSKSVTSIITKK
jgi:hypothetical protein